MHPQLLKEYTERKEKCKKDAEKRKLNNNVSTPVDQMAKHPKFTQKTLQQSVKDKSSAPVGQDVAEHLILNYIVNSLSPLSHVEHPSFVALLNGLRPISVLFLVVH